MSVCTIYPDFYEDDDVKNIDLELDTLKQNVANIKQILQEDDFMEERFYLVYAAGLQNSTDEYYKNIAIMLLSGFFNIQSLANEFDKIKVEELNSITEPDMEVLIKEVDYFFDDYKSLKAARAAIKGFCITDDVALAKLPNILTKLTATETSMLVDFDYLDNSQFEFKDLAHDNLTDEFFKFTDSINIIEYGADIDSE